MLQIKNVSLYRGQKHLFSAADFTFYAGQRIGVVGRNGSGKTSFFMLLQNKLHAEQGDVSWPSNVQIGWVSQELPDTNDTAIEYVLKAHQELQAVRESIEKAQAQEDGHAIALAYSKYEELNGYQSRSAASELLSGVGFSTEDMDKKVKEFSGGWQMRLNLVCALFSPSDVLLLDEPTNHLDIDGMIWLEKWLSNYPGLLFLISHDRVFLDRLSTHILHFDQEKLLVYSGNYSEFERLRAERQMLQEKMQEKQEKIKAHWQSFIDRFKAKASKAKQAQSRMKMLERMSTIDILRDSQSWNISFDTDKVPDQLLNLKDIEFFYDKNKPIFKKMNLQIRAGDRLAVIGRNGIGKSTLMKLLAGVMSPIDGDVQVHQATRIGYFSQNQMELLMPEENAFVHLQHSDPKSSSQSLRNFLGRFGFGGDLGAMPVKHLSGGEKARLVFAILIWKRPNVLLLDEPTNHLDMDMREALMCALQTFQGALVLVAHDRFLVDALSDRLCVIADSQVRAFDGSLEEYESHVRSYFSKTKKTNSSMTKFPEKNEKKITKKNVVVLEKKLEILYLELSNIDEKLAGITYDRTATHTLIQYSKQRDDIKKQIAQLENEWLEENKTFE